MSDTQPKPPPLVYAVVVNYHGETLTERAIETIVASQGVDARVILVDNESDGLWLSRYAHGRRRVTGLCNRDNVGFGAACNQGIRLALESGAEFVVLVNNDAVLEPDALALLVPGARRTGLAAPRILLPDGRIYSAGGLVELGHARCRNRGIYEADDERWCEPQVIDFASGCVLMMSRTALDSGVRFDEGFFLYYEDADLCLAFAAKGWRVSYVPAAVAVHHESSSAGPREAPPRTYYEMRNRWRWLWRHLRRHGASGGGSVVAGLGRLAMLHIGRWMIALAEGPADRAHALGDALWHGLTGRGGPWPRAAAARHPESAK